MQDMYLKISPGVTDFLSLDLIFLVKKGQGHHKLGYWKMKNYV